MFYYLHLTRPPPEQAHPSQPLLITPNIANDLRTEYPSPGEKGIDIYYAWVKCIEPGVEEPSSDKKGVLRSSSSHTDREGVWVRYRLGPMTQPQKLTTWKGNSYKEVQVFPPKEAARSYHGGRSSGVGGTGSGSRWQLLLCTRSSLISTNAAHEQQGNGVGLGLYATSIDLSAENFKCIFPILSAPVLFTSGSTKGNRAEKRKQVRNERLFKIPSPPWKASSPINLLRVMEHLSYDLDKKVWDSGVGLSYWLVSNMFKATNIELQSEPGSSERSELMGTSNDTIPTIVRDLMQTKRATILELGTGTGLVSIVLANLLSHYRRDISVQSETTTQTQTKINIIATDLPSAMEILQSNLSDNGSKHGGNFFLPSSGPSIQAKAVVLDWDDYLDSDGYDEQEKKRSRKSELPMEIQDGVDFIIMADVAYNTASFPSLIHLLDKLSRLPNPRFQPPPPQFHSHNHDRDHLNLSTTTHAQIKHTRTRRTPSPVVVLLAYKERDPEERRFWDMARDIGLRFDEIGRVPGAGGMPVEIYSGTFIRDGHD